VHDLALHLCGLGEIGLGNCLACHLAQHRVDGNAIADKLQEGIVRRPPPRDVGFDDHARRLDQGRPHRQRHVVEKNNEERLAATPWRKRNATERHVVLHHLRATTCARICRSLATTTCRFHQTVIECALYRRHTERTGWIRD
jgi:hypothetical protein